MKNYNVILSATLWGGTLTWEANVLAEDEGAAFEDARNLFYESVDGGSTWKFYYCDTKFISA